MVNIFLVKARISLKELKRCGAFPESFRSPSTKAWFTFFEVRKAPGWAPGTEILPSSLDCLAEEPWAFALSHTQACEQEAQWRHRVRGLALSPYAESHGAHRDSPEYPLQECMYWDIDVNATRAKK